MKVVFEDALVIKSIFDFLKDINSEMNLYFMEEGIEVMTMDESHITLVKVFIPVEVQNFTEVAEVGVNMIHFSKILKCIVDNSKLTLQVKEDRLDITIGNYDFELTTIILEEERLEIPETEYEYEYKCESEGFSKVCKNLLAFSGTVQLGFDDGTITLQSVDSIGNKIKNTFSSLECVNIAGDYEVNCSLVLVAKVLKILVLNKTFDLKTNEDNPLLLYSSCEAYTIYYFVAPKIEED